VESGYDLQGLIPFKLMRGRLGVYDKQSVIVDSTGVENLGN
jgi:hypothetical protein